MFSGFDFKKLLQSSQKMSEMFQMAKKRLAEKTISGTSGAGLVSATVNGNQELLQLNIDPQLLKAEEAKFLNDLICSAINDALAQSKDLMQRELQEMGADLGLPLNGLFQ